MRRVAKGLRQRVGHRGSALLFFAVLDLVYCASLLFPSPRERHSPGLRFLADIVPLWVWAAAWGGVGLLCLSRSFRRRDAAAFAAAIGIKLLWAIVGMAAWLFGGVERGYLTTVVWLGFATLVAIIASWPEPPPGWKARTWTER